MCLCAISLGRICPFQSLPFLFAFAHSGIRCVTVFGRCDSNFRSRCPSILVLSCAIPFNCAGGVVHLGCVRQHERGSMALGMLFHSGFNSCLAGEIFHGVLRFFLLRWRKSGGGEGTNEGSVPFNCDVWFMVGKWGCYRPYCWIIFRESSDG